MSKLLTKHKLLKYLIVAVLIAVPIYPKFPFIEIPGTYVAVRLEDFLVLILGIFVLAYWLPKLKELFADSLTRKIAVFLFIGLVATLSGIFLTKTAVFHLGLFHWIRRIEYFIPLLAGLIIFREKREGYLEFFVKILILVTVIVFIYGFGQKHFSWPVIVTQNEEYAKGVALRYVTGSHINSTFAGHYDLATFLVLILPVFVSLFFTLSGKLTRLFLFVAIFCGFWLLSNAISRISIVSFLLGVSLSLLLLKKYKEIFIVLIASLVFFSFSSDLISRYESIIGVTKAKIQRLLYLPSFEVLAQSPSVPEKRIRSETPTASPTPVFEDRSTSIRTNVEWPRAIRAFSKNPILGTGYSSITLATDSDYLRAFGEIGILGFLAFILVLVEIAMIFFKALPLVQTNLSPLEKGFAAGIIGSFPGVLTNAAFIDIFEASKFAVIFWLLIGIAVSLVRISKNEKIN